MMKQDELLEKRIRELANHAFHKGIITYTNFLNPDELQTVHSRNFHSQGVCIKTWGGYENAERQIAAFFPDAFSFEKEYPISCLQIQPKSLKFADRLTHRDYLGAVLGLGLERHLIGDILVGEENAWLFCLERMCDYILDNLTAVSHTQVLVTSVTDLQKLPKPRFIPVEGTVASCRLDALLALAFKESRSKLIKYIQQGQVFVNGRLITSNSYIPKEGDVISLRGKGRFAYHSRGNQTKKGRYRVLLYRYQ